MAAWGMSERVEAGHGRVAGMFGQAGEGVAMGMAFALLEKDPAVLHRDG